MTWVTVGNGSNLTRCASTDQPRFFNPSTMQLTHTITLTAANNVVIRWLLFHLLANHIDSIDNHSLYQLISINIIITLQSLMNRLSFPLSANKINIISVNLYRSSPSAVTDDIGIVRYSRALHCIAEHCIVWRGIAWYQMVLYGAAWHCTGFHHHAPPCLAPPCPSCTIFHDFAPCCTRLHRIH